MDGDAHEGALGDASALECPRQVIAFEPRDARPKADVCRGRVLGLEAADSLECPRERKLFPLEQQLTREERAVQIPLGERSLGHPAESTTVVRGLMRPESTPVRAGGVR